MTHHPPADHLIHGRFRKGRRDRLAMAIPVPVVGDRSLVGLDVMVKLAHGLEQLVDLGCSLMRHGLGQRTRSWDGRSAPGLLRSPIWADVPRIGPVSGFERSRTAETARTIWRAPTKILRRDTPAPRLATRLASFAPRWHDPCSLGRSGRIDSPYPRGP